MSGGYFDYEQYKITMIADEVEQLIERNGKKREYREDWQNECHDKYSPQTIKKFRQGLELLRKAQIYAQRIDWLVSADDSEETFLKRLENDLNNLKKISMPVFYTLEDVFIEASSTKTLDEIYNRIINASSIEEIEDIRYIDDAFMSCNNNLDDVKEESKQLYQDYKQ
jgi:hypothetical protein